MSDDIKTSRLKLADRALAPLTIHLCQERKTVIFMDDAAGVGFAKPYTKWIVPQAPKKYGESQ